MSAYSFMPQFVAKMLAGEKPHTIRALRKDSRVPRVGEPFHAYTAMRTKVCTWLFSSEITKVQAITIGKPWTDFGLCPTVTIDEVTLTWADGDALASADGFDCMVSFRNHFTPKCFEGPDFTGHLIHWRPEDAKATHHHCPACGERIQWCEKGRGFVCVCSMTEVFYRFKRPTPAHMPPLPKP